MKKILLTGATGFLGSALLRRLVDHGYDVVVLKRSFSDTWRISDLVKKIVVYDVDRVSLIQIFEQQRIDIIVHTATNYGRQESSLFDVLQDNLIFPSTLLEYGLKNKVDLFVNTDSFFNKGFEIKHEYLPNYTLSKRLFVEVLRYNSSKIRTVNCKLEHVYGPKDGPSKFIPAIINLLLSNKPEIALSTGIQKRDFVFVEDVVDLYSLIIENMEKLTFGFQEIEVGTGRITSIRELVTLMKEITQNSASTLAWGAVPNRVGEIDESSADLTKRIFDWIAKTGLEAGLKITVDYQRTNGKEQ
jgi:nucleoside-diphosphate-sugar epimerase